MILLYICMFVILHYTNSCFFYFAGTHPTIGFSSPVCHQLTFHVHSFDSDRLLCDISHEGVLSKLAPTWLQVVLISGIVSTKATPASSPGPVGYRGCLLHYPGNDNRCM